MQFLIRFYLFFCFLLTTFLIHAQTRQVILPIQPIEVHDLVKVKGDCEMYGHNPQISINVNTCVNGDKVVLSGLIKLKENKADWTTFVQEFRQEIPVQELASQNVVFASFQQGEGALRASAGMHQHQYKTFQGQGLIKSANILSDTNGEDCGKLGGTIHFHPLVMHVTEAL
ncbi:MAG: hypothetical protein AAF587_28595 [Bacteroidota bacterium]